MEKKKLFGLTLSELSEVVRDASLPPYAAKQIAGWLYHRGAPAIGAMTDLSTAARKITERIMKRALTRLYLNHLPVTAQRSISFVLAKTGSLKRSLFLTMTGQPSACRYSWAAAWDAVSA